jgi:hypothetical protein
MPTQTTTLTPAPADTHAAHTPKGDRATSSKFRVLPGAALLALLIATVGAVGASSAPTPAISHVTKLHVSYLTIDRDTVTGRVSGFPPRQKVTINTASYDAGPTGTVHLAKGRLNGLTRLQLNFTDKNGYISTGAAALKHAGTGLALTRSERHGATPQRTMPQTIKLTVLPVMYSPPPNRPKHATKR